MQITILADEVAVVMRRLAIIGLVGAAFFSVAAAADPYQPARAILVALSVVLLVFGARGFRSEHSRSAFVLLAVFATWSLVSAAAASPASTLWGVHGRFQGIATMILYVAAALAGWLWAGRDIKWLIRAAAAASALQGSFVIYQAATGLAPEGTIGNRVLLGAWLVVTVAAGLAGARVTRSPERWWLLAASAVGVVGLGLAGSRGAWVGLLLVGIFFVLTSRLKTAWPVGVAAILIVVVAVASGGEVAAKLSPSSLLTGSAASRWEIWKSSAEMVADRPLLGVGPGRYLYEFPAYESIEHARLEGPDIRPDQAHSHLLQVATEGGLAPAFALIGLIGLAGAAALRAARRGDAASLVAGAMFAAFVGQGIFGISAVETDALGWLAGGVLIARGVAPAQSRGLSRTESSAERSPEGALTPGRIALLSLTVALAVGVGAGSVYYASADIHHARGLEHFSQASFEDGRLAHATAISLNPLVDVYRVGLADAAMFQSPAEQRDALEVLDRGLELEPDSYDLARQRARLLGLTEGSTQATIDAYALAIQAYPLSIGTRLDAIAVFVDAGRHDDAREMAQDVLDTRPDDPQLRETVEGILGGT